MRLPASLVVCFVASACGAFSAAPNEAGDAGSSGSSGGDAGPAGDGASGAPKVCPVAGFLFCSDFERGELTAEWPGAAVPAQFLTLGTDPDPLHAHVAHATMTTVMDANAPLFKELGGHFDTVTYAFDLRIDGPVTPQEIEVATVVSAKTGPPLAFHIAIAGSRFVFAEFLADVEYQATDLGPTDAAWHHFEVTIDYRAPVRVKARMDQTEINRDMSFAAGAAAGDPQKVGVGVTHIDKATAPFSYSVDNFMATWK
jgi:hypothetical protein